MDGILAAWNHVADGPLGPYNDGALALNLCALVTSNFSRVDYAALLVHREQVTPKQAYLELAAAFDGDGNTLACTDVLVWLRAACTGTPRGWRGYSAIPSTLQPATNPCSRTCCSIRQYKGHGRSPGPTSTCCCTWWPSALSPQQLADLAGLVQNSAQVQQNAGCRTPQCGPRAEEHTRGVSGDVSSPPTSLPSRGPCRCAHTLESSRQCAQRRILHHPHSGMHVRLQDPGVGTRTLHASDYHHLKTIHPCTSVCRN
jgi:hypothetical protein